MKPQIVLVHGSWHKPEHYRFLTDLLQKIGFQFHCPHLPTCAFPTIAVFDHDVDTVRNTMDNLVNNGHEVILLMHSYGGVVGSEAADGYSVSDRSSKGLKGGIVHLIYMCAYMLMPDETLAQASFPRPDPEWVEFGTGGTTYPYLNPKHLFYADVDDTLANECVKLLTRQGGLKGGNLGLPHTPWMSTPTTYITCTEDQALEHEWQEQHLKGASERGVSIDIQTLQSSHSPFLSMPEKVVDIVSDVAQKYI